MQHIAPDIHDAPRAVHSPHTPPRHDRPLQQSLLAEQALPRLRHWHVPFWQVIEPQQSLLALHWVPAVAQAQRPPVHDRPLQHSALLVQVPPAGLQHRPEVLLVLDVQVTEPQHDGPPVMHVCPAWIHIVPIIWQRPPWHTSGDWQSLLCVHAPPSVCRLQRPLRQESSPQHCASEVHVPESPRQQRVAPCAVAHIVPLSHMPWPGVHEPPAGMGVL